MNARRMDISRFIVEVTGFETESEANDLYGLTVSDIGGKSVGTFTWDTGGGILLEKWGGGFNKNIDLRRGGKFCSISGGTVYLDNTKGLRQFMQEAGIDLSGSKISIKMVSDTTAGSVCLFTGVVTSLESSQNELNLSYDEPTKYRNVVISLLMDDGETYYPAVFGDVGKAKFIPFVNKVKPVIDMAFEMYEVNTQAALDEYDNESISASITNPRFVEEINKIQGYLSAMEAGGATEEIPALYYLYCVGGKGQGVARRIKRILGSSGGYVFILEGAPYITKEGATLSREFLAPNGAEPAQYDQISTFKIYTVDIRYRADAAGLFGIEAAGRFSRYVYDNGYISIPINQVFLNRYPFLYSSLGTESIVAPARFADNFEKVETLVKLYGRNFMFESDYLQSPGYDSAVFGLQWRYKVGRYVPPLGTFALFTQDTEYDSRGLGIRELEVKAGDLFQDTHDTKIQFTIEQSYDAQSFGVPFTFEFYRPLGASEIMLNYDIVLTLTTLGDDTDLVHLMEHSNSYYEYNLLTTLIGEALPYNNAEPRVYPVDHLQFRTFRQESGDWGDYIKVIRTHRINTCWDLDGFKNAEPGSEIYERDAYLGGLANNGCFSRQDIMKAPLFRQIERGINSWLNLTNYISGSEVVRNKGTGGDGFIKIPPAVLSSEGGVLKFRAVLFSTQETGFYTDLGLYNKIKLKNIQCLAKKEFQVGAPVYGNAEGRHVLMPDGGSFDIKNSWGAIYRGVLGLQNYAHTYFPQFTRPADGWGKALSTSNPREDFSLVMEMGYYRFSYYGDVWMPPENTWQPALRRQLFTAEELSTQNIKADLLRTAWRGGYLDGDGRERVFNMIEEGDGAENTARITYKDIIPGTLGKIGSVSKEDIFCEVFLKFNYDIGSDRYLHEIAVAGIDTDNPRVTGNVTEHLSPEQRDYLLNACKRLYSKYKIINEAPKTLTENKWLRGSCDDPPNYVWLSVQDAYEYLRRWLEWQGGKGDGALTARQEISFTLPLRFAVEAQIDIGRRIEIEIPYAGGTFNGLISSVSWQFDKGREEVRCKAYIEMPVESDLTGVDSIEELGYADKNIFEEGYLPEIIQETGTSN